jgi:hypothetical protein
MSVIANIANAIQDYAKRYWEQPHADMETWLSRDINRQLQILLRHYLRNYRPHRHITPYNRFVQENYHKLREQGIDSTKIFTSLAAKWRSMTQEEMDKYTHVTDSPILGAETIPVQIHEQIHEQKIEQKIGLAPGPNRDMRRSDVEQKTSSITSQQYKAFKKQHIAKLRYNNPTWSRARIDQEIAVMWKSRHIPQLDLSTLGNTVGNTAGNGTSNNIINNIIQDGDSTIQPITESDTKYQENTNTVQTNLQQHSTTTNLTILEHGTEGNTSEDSVSLLNGFPNGFPNTLSNSLSVTGPNTRHDANNMADKTIPPNSLDIFLTKTMPKIIAENPNLSRLEHLMKAREIWINLSNEEKEKFAK